MLVLTNHPTTTYYDRLMDRLTSRTALIGVVGLGYVGLPLAVEHALAGFSVIGLDDNLSKVERVNRGENYIPDVDSNTLKALTRDKRLKATGDYQALTEADVIIICVPTPLTTNKEPDLSYILAVADKVRKIMRPGQLIALESTTYPGTTEEVLQPILETSGLKIGEEFFLAFSPERVNPGDPVYKTRNTPKLVGGVTEKCRKVATALYQQSITQVIPVSSPRVAELSKVFENTYRAVNIALVNELALLCDRMQLDVWEVLEAAGTKPFGIQIFQPGPGVGGHCIPLDPFYLSWKAREYDFPTRFIELAGEINLRMPYFVVDKVTRAMNARKKAINGSKILLLGIAYKKDIDDERESPALKVFELLEQQGAHVEFHDPYVPVVKPHTFFSRQIRSVELTQELLESQDCVVITTDHSCIDYEWVVNHSALVVDSRNATKKLGGRDNIVRL
ncbi:nucleotide sugar dehydrogenase [Sulfobacillus thermosulfidooxidans]|uniref:Nucleotide sugar dehydrogenase n=1 Tax=Sulfobacillus thermosulfidooxidans TaxID=28034 RepID=A0A1R0IWE4_SULTH|nr:nucleotide sugar dehydrogenase [Sulfobacillus thermosulfidooxidans]OLZ11692.1 UDP-N-acetyl-D-glucosamine dehydrogenase [Sulfobacillus thermosulfidooxidans]OLZ18655.1 UDP-N-acetyl-D-glucosamine dehydrogenase [Sulfobacillus thermosulfidooxidans]OLZ20266.1 UDP-N-acetyl-D-glucosamine dehydrogenase [Sulfobacillus thermosulfidooxidans]PSR28995.1 MAG: nucleotide sugar dehydrogenase [Sulfobacillus thermosulfidooxidans]